MSIPKVCCLALALALVPLAPASAGRMLDEGKLDTSWYGDDREFRKADEIDYLWVQPGFSLAGKKVHFAEWMEPQLLGEKAGERDAKDKRLAANLTGDMPEIFAEAFRNGLAGTVTVVKSGETSRSSGGSSTARKAAPRRSSGSAWAPAPATPPST